MIQDRLSSLSLLATFGIVATACGGSADDSASGNPDTQKSGAFLTQAHDCGDLLAMLQDDTIAKMNAIIDDHAEHERLSRQPGHSDYNPYAGVGGTSAGWDDTTDGAGSDSASPGVGTGDSSDEHSTTNTQVDGVDEADIVKTDGKFIYLLHGQEFLVLSAWPAETLAKTSSFAIEGVPSEMYVTEDGKVVVYSIVAGEAIYAAAGITPRRGLIEHTGAGTYDPCNGIAPCPKAPLTKITVLQLDGADASVAREMYFEGIYASSRRVGNHVRTVLLGSSYGPSLDDVAVEFPPYWDEDWETKHAAAVEKYRAEIKAKILNTTIQDWLPYHFVSTNAGYQVGQAQCNEFYVPPAGSTAYGVTQVQSIDLDAPTDMPKGTSVMGLADTLYSNADTLVVAAHGWFHWSGCNSADVLSNLPISVKHTHLHTFDLAADPAKPHYTASGTVPGSVPDQFSMDIHEGYLRVVTTEQRVENWESAYMSPSHLFVLAVDENELVQIGSVQNFGSPCRAAFGYECLRSTRFMGDHAYTSGRTDPLVAMNLADPADPVVLGQVNAPGFSGYMHSLDDNHLLTIGHDNGPVLRIFDVANPVSPLQTHKYSFSDRDAYGVSKALYDRKAFTYFASKKLLALPYLGFDEANNLVRSSLEVLDIDINKGISPRGSIDHTDLLDGIAGYDHYCGVNFGHDVRRGVFLGDFVYSTSYGGVKANHIDALVTPVAVLRLDAPTLSAFSCYYEE